MARKSMDMPSARGENPESRGLTERLEAGINKAKEFFEKTAFTLGIAQPEGTLSPAEQELTRKKIERLVGATVTGIIMAGAIPEALSPQAAEASMQYITVHGEKFQKAKEQAEKELVVTMAFAEIPVGTSMLRIGPSEYIPASMPQMLPNAPASKSVEAGNSSFQLKSIEEIPAVKGGKIQRVAVYESLNDRGVRAGIKDPETVKIKTTVPEDKEITLPLFTNEDQKISLSRIEAVYKLPIGDKSKSTTSQGVTTEAVSQFPLTDDGSVKMELGAAYAVEYGTPGTNLMAPPFAGKDRGFKVSPSLGIAWSPWTEDKISGMRAELQPNFTEAPFTISDKRPAVLLGSWTQRMGDQNWWQYKISTIAEFGDEKTIGTIPRFQTKAVFDKAFIVNSDFNLGITVGIGAQSTYLAQQGAESRKPFQVPVRIGGMMDVEMFDGTYELNVTANIIAGRDDLPEVAVETSLQKKN